MKEQVDFLAGTTNSSCALAVSEFAKAENFWKGLTSHKKEVEKAGEIWVKLGETDHISYLTAVMAKKPEAICLAFGASGLIPFVKQAKMFGLFDKIPVFAFGLADSVFAKVLGKDMPTGVYGGSNYLWYYPATPAIGDSHSSLLKSALY